MKAFILSTLVVASLTLSACASDSMAYDRHSPWQSRFSPSYQSRDDGAEFATVLNTLVGAIPAQRYRHKNVHRSRHCNASHTSCSSQSSSSSVSFGFGG